MKATNAEEGGAPRFTDEEDPSLGGDHQENRFVVRFWGVRGSYPVSSAATQRVGGNTACVEVRVGGQEIILDAGTGLIALGQHLSQRMHAATPNLTLLLSHFHYDHILGLPFFDPLYQAGARLHLFGPRMGGKDFAETLSAAITSPYFPVDLRAVPSTCTFVTLETGDVVRWRPGALAPTLHQGENSISGSTEPCPEPESVCVTCLHSVAHPRDGCLVYRITCGGRSLVYATDVEEQADVDQDLIDFIRGADVLIHDAQYQEADYAALKQGYGHSTPEMAIAVAQAAGVKRLILFHHDPGHDDAVLEGIWRQAQATFPATMLAYEGLELTLL